MNTNTQDVTDGRDELKKILADIDEVLVKGDETAEGLWSVMTALRGPDNDAPNEERKLNSTAQIRAASFPRTAEVVRRGAVWLGGYMGEVDDPATKITVTPGYDHYNDHAKRAARALGLEIDEQDVLSPRQVTWRPV